MEEWPLEACMVLLVCALIVGVWLGFRLIQRNIRKRNEIWSELARQTSLDFKPMGFLTSPSVSGEYRGRHLSLARISVGDWESQGLITQLNVRVNNHGRVSLTIRGRWILDRLLGRSDVSSGNDYFDRSFSVKGSPLPFVQEALQIIVRRESRLFTLLISNRPSIWLKGPSLICSPAELAHVADLIALFDLLCDLADLAEQIDGEGAAP
jgi:hypothetical protein